MDIHDEILSFLTAYGLHGKKRFNCSDVFIANGFEGDDANELVDDFAKRFNVDMTRFIEHWYFHYIGDEPPGHRRVLPIDIHGKVLPFIPVSIDMLAASAEAGKWILSYPEHTVRTCLRSRLALIGFCAVFIIVLTSYVRTFFGPT